MVKLLKAGERVGYSGTHITTQRQWVGTIPIGHAEGFDVRHSPDFVVIDDKRVAIIGL